MLRENGNEKGGFWNIIISLKKMNTYITMIILKHWKNLKNGKKQEDKILEDDNLDYNGTTFWRLNKYSSFR